MPRSSVIRLALGVPAPARFMSCFMSQPLTPLPSSGEGGREHHERDESELHDGSDDATPRLLCDVVGGAVGSDRLVLSGTGDAFTPRSFRALPTVHGFGARPGRRRAYEPRGWHTRFAPRETPCPTSAPC